MGRNYSFFPFFKLMMSTGIIIGILCGLGLGIIIFLPALIRKQRLDTAKLKEYEAREYETRTKLEDLVQECIDKDKERINLESCVDSLKKDVDIQHEALMRLHNEEATARKTLASLADTEQKVKTNMEKSIEERSEALSKEYREAELNYAKEYEIVMIDAVEDFTKEWNKKTSELYEVTQKIADKQAIYQAILEDEQRKAKEEAERDFYRLNVPSEDLSEIEKIREITPYLRNPEVLNKVLWTSYYQKPYQDLISRLFNTNKPSGIYKITCLPDGKIYIGQSVNVPNRFSEHIKRGLGAEPATRNRLYPAMKKWGVENFIFELLEEVPREKLDERERYWIEFFHSAEVGLNGNKGVKG